jgi:predicted enzyme related to lactoylglutathione lyase
MNPTFIWYELMAQDPAAAQDFYTAVVGWRASDAGGPNSGYRILSSEGGGVGGIAALPLGARPGWFGYVAVPDTDAAAAKIESAGGKVLRAPDDIPRVGRFAVVADPGGAAFMLLTPTPAGEPPAPRHRTEPGQVGWRELHATDGDAAFSFYSEQFGWREESVMDMGPMGTYRLWSPAEGEAVGAMMTKRGDEPAAWLFYFSVDGIDSAAERVRGRGGKVLREPQEVPDGSWIIHAADPQGNLFALVSRTR